MQKLAVHIAEVLVHESDELGVHWQTQAQSYAPRADGAGPLLDTPRAARIVATLGRVLRNEPRCKDELMRVGWDYGSSVHLAGVSLHVLLKEIELLEAILLYACERAADARADARASDGIAVARRVNRAFALFTLAAAKGFTNAYLGSLQDHYRALRHDLRNPLGTIKSAVSLMEDPSVAPELRNNPRFRQMVVRNAQNLDQVISEQLSDASTLVPAFARQTVSLRDVAVAVRRDFREEAREAHCTLVVEDDLPTVQTDSTSFELALSSVIGAALAGTAPGGVVRIALGELRAHSAVLRVTAEPLTPGEGIDRPGAIDFAAELSSLAGGRVWREGDAVLVEVPVTAESVAAPRA